MQCILFFLFFLVTVDAFTQPRGDRDHVLHKKCGIQAIEPVFREDRIFNGRKAVLNSWPWQASLYGVFAIGNELLYWYQCGGAILNDRWIVTAAHCFFYPPEILALREWRIHAGEQYKDLAGETVQVQLVDKYILHENFTFVNKTNDIALIKLTKPLNLTDYVHPVCLPSVDEKLEDGEYCVVAGFSHDKTDIIPERAAFYQLITPIISREKCSTEDFYGKLIGNNMLCSGHTGGQNYTCQGDSGRPLMCLCNDKWTVSGVLSFGHNKCGEPNKPGVYTRIASYLPWILKKIEND